jgi:hypothetical protein
MIATAPLGDPIMKLEMQMLPGDDVELLIDRATARLIADALDIIQPDDPATREWASDTAFTMNCAMDAWPAPSGQPRHG